MRKGNGAVLSLRRSENVRGYTVRRLPLGEYLLVMESLRDMPDAFMQACFPQMDAAQVLTALRTMDAPSLSALMLRAMEVLPGEAIRLLALLTGVSEEALLTDPDIGLDGAAELAEAFWRLNGIGNFMHAARSLAAQAAQMRGKTGCSG